MGGRRSSGGTERVHRRARTHAGKGEWKAGAFQWGGLNEDAADYPIRKFSLHFDRARRAASNKNYSVLYSIRFPLLRYPPFFLRFHVPPSFRSLLSLARKRKGESDENPFTFDFHHLEGISRYFFLKLKHLRSMLKKDKRCERRKETNALGR